MELLDISDKQGNLTGEVMDSMKINERRNIVEVVLSGSGTGALHDSPFKENIIVELCVLFSIGDLSNIDKYIVEVPNEIYHEKIIDDLSDAVLKLNDCVDKGYKVRVWSSHCDVDYYLFLLFICNVLKNKTNDLIVLYSDEYNKECYSPGEMTGEELEELSHVENVLSKEDIIKLSNEWDKVKNENNDVRIIVNGEVKSVTYNYFDDEIIDLLKNKESLRIIDLSYDLVRKYRITSNLFIFLISRLIDLKKIEVIERNEMFIKSVIKLVDTNE